MPNWTKQTLVRRLSEVIAVDILDNADKVDAEHVLFNPHEWANLESMTAADLIDKLRDEATKEAFRR